MNQFDNILQFGLDSMTQKRMGLAATNFHQYATTRRLTSDFID
jgi:hypothetical protein